MRNNQKLVSVWVPLEDAEAFAEVARDNERTVSAEIRHLMRLRLALAERDSSRESEWEVRTA